MKKGTIIVAASIVAILAMIFVSSRFFVDLFWFSSMGLGAVFTTRWLTVLAVFVIAAGLSAALLVFNGLIAARISTGTTKGSQSFRVVGRGAQGLPEVIELSLDKLPWTLIICAVALIVGVLIGLAQTGNWDTILKWIHATSFRRTDPLFGRDLGFYVFTLPVYELVKDWALLMVVLCGAISGVIYLVRGEIDYQQSRLPTISAAAMRHLSALLAVFFLVKAGGYLLKRYELLTSHNGIVLGAAYADVHLRLPILVALAGAALLAAALCLYNLRQASLRLPIGAIAIVFVM